MRLPWGNKENGRRLWTWLDYMLSSDEERFGTGGGGTVGAREHGDEMDAMQSAQEHVQ